ncbi:unnamed protein product, partial [Ectocarpus sp. 4 AP-2014]
STACPRGIHFAAVLKKDRSTPPFPLVRAAPPLFQALDAVLNRESEAEQAAYKASLAVQP